MEKTPYTHILQKTGVLKSFTVAKVVKKQEIEELKKLIKKVSSSDEEYKRILDEEMAKLSNMHDKANPIPGIIYGGVGRTDETKVLIYNITKKFCQNLKKQDFTRSELAFLITAIINELGLTHTDFSNLKNEINKELEEPEDSDEYGGESDGEVEGEDDSSPGY